MRLQLLAGDTLVAPSPTGEYRVTIGPDEDAEGWAQKVEVPASELVSATGAMASELSKGQL